MRGRRTLVEREDRGQEQAQPPRNPHECSTRPPPSRERNGSLTWPPSSRSSATSTSAKPIPVSGKPSLETSIYLSNRPVAAKIAADAIRQHWGIENKSHYTRNVTFQEDASRIRTNPGIFARLRTIAYNVLRCSQSQTMPQDRFAAALGGLQVKQGLQPRARLGPITSVQPRANGVRRDGEG